MLNDLFWLVIGSVIMTATIFTCGLIRRKREKQKVRKIILRRLEY